MDHGESSYRRFLDGDDEGICEIVKEYKDGLTFYLNSIVGDVCLAEELMQDTFTKLVIKRPRFRGESAFKTWLYAIGRNIALDAVRRRKTASVPLDEVENYIEEALSLEEEYLKTEENLNIRRAMDKLKADYSQALWLLYFESFTYKEAAGIMKRSVKQFDNLVYRAKKALREELEKEGVVYEGL